MSIHTIVRKDENLIQWAVRVRINLQELLIKQKFSVYHNFCLFASYPGGKLEDFNYYRPKPFKNGTAICFGCWKVIRVNVNVKPRKIFYYSRRSKLEINSISGKLRILLGIKKVMTHKWLVTFIIENMKNIISHTIG